MVHNTADFWRHLQSLEHDSIDLPSPRVCRLLDRVFRKWDEKPVWPSSVRLGHLFDGLSDEEKNSLIRVPIPVRRGKAIRKTLNRLVDRETRHVIGGLRIHPDEIILGTMPPYSVGQGKELVGYLTEEEELRFALNWLSDRSAFGHIVPNHDIVLKVGVAGLIERTRENAERIDHELRMAKVGQTADDYGNPYCSAHPLAKMERQLAFFHSVIEALNGLLEFAKAFEDAARDLAARYPEGSAENLDLVAAAERLRRVPAHPANSFVEAVQSIFITHCSLHASGETVSVGRLDQLLAPYYQADIDAGLLPADPHKRRVIAQEVIDCLWLKFGERAILSNRFLEDRFGFADGALLGNKGPSNFDQGCLLNQWMQQVTIGGYKANDALHGEDGTNEVTFLCLEASRRLPLNSPTLDLRLHKEVERIHGDSLFRAAAKTLLSGGAHPVLMNDDRIVPALLAAGANRVSLSSARNYACDGCYETLFAGESEFSFGFVPAIELLENAINSGAGVADSGHIHLRGYKRSWRSPPASEIGSFEVLLDIFRKHLSLSCHRFLNGILTFYGEKEEVCPSPLLSALIDGCLDSGRDLAGGGARYHLFAPLMVGISTCVDSLHAIREVVFRDKFCSLEELVYCLRTNWGELVHEDENLGLSGLSQHVESERIDEIHSVCSAQQRFGHGHAEVDRLAWWLIETFHDSLETARKHPLHQPAISRLKERYGADFELTLTPGVGTFEQYVFSGFFAGATPDGRRAREPIASDLSPSPLLRHHDPLATAQRHSVELSLEGVFNSFRDASIDLLCDGAPPDLNLPEDFSEDDLTKAIAAFAAGDAGNMMTFTVADPSTFAAAMKEPESYNLLRVRMGGWTEFFVALFPAHMEQHRRRPLVTSLQATALTR